MKFGTELTTELNVIATMTAMNSVIVRKLREIRVKN